MKRGLLLLLGLGLTSAGAFVGVTASARALEARRHLVSELSATLGRARALDTIAQQVRAENGTARPAQDLLRDAMTGSRSPEETAALQSSLACLGDGGCDDATVPLAGAHASFVTSVEPLWREVDAAEGTLRGAALLALVLLVLGLVAVAAGGAAGLGGASPPEEDAGPPAVLATPGIERGVASDSLAMQDVLRQRLEALYQARSQLGASARFGAFGELAAALSHGLKTPLAGVQAATQLAQLKLGEGSAAREELAEVVRLTEGLTEQVQRFLRAAGQVGPQREQVRVADLLAQLDAAYAEPAKRRGVTFTTSALEPGATLEVDVPLLDMALKNLVENALAAVKGGQAVSVSVQGCAPPSRVGLDGVAPAAGATFLAFVIDDEGPGLPVEARRAEPGVTTRAAGSGLGLTIARRVAERHGGALVIEDRPGGGARIRLVVPLPGRGSPS